MNQPSRASSKIVVEVCTGSLAGALIAESAGADRIELNAALELDGLTPSAGLLELVSDAIRIPVITMARPRAGDFFYSESEWETLIADARWMLDHGADGIAFGCLDENRNVDLGRCHQIRELAGAHEVVFHKAFDEVADWREGLERLIDAGINRVMTSGQSPTAEVGLTTITEMVRLAAGRIEVLPAGSVNSKNVVKIVNQSGTNQVHGSFSSREIADVGSEIRQVIDHLATGSIAH
jgi:copper homeostasis protein